MVTLKQFARLGGKARWKGVAKKARSEAMKKVRRGLSTDSLEVLDTSKHVE